MDNLDLGDVDEHMNMDSINLNMDIDVNMDEDVALNIKGEGQGQEQDQGTQDRKAEQPEPRQQDQVRVKEQEVEPEQEVEANPEKEDNDRNQEQDDGATEDTETELRDKDPPDSATEEKLKNPSQEQLPARIKEEDFAKKAREESGEVRSTTAAKDKATNESETLPNTTTTMTTNTTTSSSSTTITETNSSWATDHDYAFLPPKIAKVESMASSSSEPVGPHPGPIRPVHENRESEPIEEEIVPATVKTGLRPSEHSPVVVLKRSDEVEEKLKDVQPRSMEHLHRIVLGICKGDETKANQMMKNLRSRSCKVRTCPKPYPVNTKFRSIPSKAFKNPEQVEKWVIACGRRPADYVDPPITKDNFRVCDKHFRPEDYVGHFLNKFQPLQHQKWLLKVDAVPSRYLTGDLNIERRRERTRQRLVRKEQKEIVKELLAEEAAKAAKTTMAYEAVFVKDSDSRKPMVTFSLKTGPPVPREVLTTKQPLTGMLPVVLPTQPASVSFVKPRPKMGNVTDLELKLEAAAERIVELERENRLLKSQREVQTNKIDELQLSVNSLKKARISTQKMLWVAKRKWNNREKIMRVTEKKKLAYAKEFMYKHTCWSRRMIDMFLDNNKTKTTWSPSDLQLGLSIYSLSPRAYRFLVNFNLLPLPAKSSLKKVRQFKRVGTETGIQLYQRTGAEPQDAMGRDEQANDIGCDDEDEEMAEADRESSSDSEEEEDEDKGDDSVEVLDSSANAQPDSPADQDQDQDFLSSLMEDVVLPEHGRSMPNM